MADLLADGTFDDGCVEATAAAGNWDDARIKRVWWSPQWIPIAEDGCGNMVCLDLDPGERGRVGQLMQMEVQDGQGPHPTAFTSFLDYLEHHLHCLQAGKCTVTDGELEVDGYL